MDIIYVALDLPRIVDKVNSDEANLLLMRLASLANTVIPLQRGCVHEDIERRTELSIYTLDIRPDGTAIMSCYPRQGTNAHVDVHDKAGNEVYSNLAKGQYDLCESNTWLPVWDRTTLEDGTDFFTLYGMIMTK